MEIMVLSLFSQLRDKFVPRDWIQEISENIFDVEMPIYIRKFKLVGYD
jgi:hypothetical protein